MDVALTGGLAAASLAATALFAWLGARPAKPMGAPRLVPYRILMMFTFALMVALLVHLVTLLKAH
jgi:hypothetical protein